MIPYGAVSSPKRRPSALTRISQPGQVRLVDGREAGVQQPQPAVVTDRLRLDLGAEIERVAAGALGADVPRRSRRRGRREVVSQLGGVVAEATRGEHDGASRDLVIADGDAGDRAVGRREQAVDPLAERDVDVVLAAVPMEDVDDALPSPDGHVDARDALVTAVDELGVVLDAKVAQPLDGRADELREPTDDGGVDIPPVELEVVVEERLGVVLDAQGPLVPRAGAHDEPTRQARRPSDDTLALRHQHTAGTRLARRQRGREPRRAGADHQHVDIGRGLSGLVHVNLLDHAPRNREDAAWTHPGQRWSDAAQQMPCEFGASSTASSCSRPAASP